MSSYAEENLISLFFLIFKGYQTTMV